MEIYNVGPDAMTYGGKWPHRDYKWLVAWYEVGDYEGWGEAVSFDGTTYRLHNLGHCSCYGPEDSLRGGDEIPLSLIIGDTVLPGMEIRPEVVNKVKELVGEVR